MSTAAWSSHGLDMDWNHWMRPTSNKCLAPPLRLVKPLGGEFHRPVEFAALRNSELEEQFGAIRGASLPSPTPLPAGYAGLNRGPMRPRPRTPAYVLSLRCCLVSPLSAPCAGVWLPVSC